MKNSKQKGLPAVVDFGRDICGDLLVQNNASGSASWTEASIHTDIGTSSDFDSKERFLYGRSHVRTLSSKSASGWSTAKTPPGQTLKQHCRRRNGSGNWCSRPKFASCATPLRLFW